MSRKDPSRSGNPAVRAAAKSAGSSGASGPAGPSPRSGSSVRSRQRLILGVLLGIVVIVLIAAVAVFSWRNSHRDPEPPAAQPSFGPVTLTNGRPIPLGEADAPVILTLFEDFGCPHCADFEHSLGPTITALQRSGEVKVELYPMSFVSDRSPALANAMACAATEGFGQGYYAGMFANYGLKWTDEQLIQLGSLVGKPSAGFAGCVRSQQHRAWVDSITRAAQQQKVEETPTVFINGVRQPDEAVTWSAAELRSRIGAAK
ncbi:thioredoxin domain-containing protein [Microlunatus sp. Gsoil 973]|uniref:DsbA family protein n=1 Tax=Microlunatus sp. Gsoil 973 TaxID=2672569 RepID=UPI0012B4ACAE|nr:thioredoxin domain-containing protein [Microlunatus sp. Gsoil 973]QGN32383.1 thioredoxin domain-containing protein [Microlunatus sp. Gsoil 973]